MKKTTMRLKLLALLALIFSAGMTYSQCTASFNYSVGPGGVVTFTSTSTGTGTSTSNYWLFGNGTTYTSTSSPTISATYSVNGVYTVQLIYLAIPSCSAAVSQTISVTTAATPTCNLIAGFTESTGSSGNAYFTNTSTGTVSGTTYYWSFGDGGAPVGNANPMHTYTNNGTYTVTLTDTNNVACISSYSAVVTITNVCNMSASFTYSTGPNGQIIFFSTSTGTGTNTSYYWNFGNGTNATYTNVTSTSATYTANGVYNVTLILYTAFCGTAQVTQTVSITNSNPPACPLNASFTAYQMSNGMVNFFDTSAGTSSITSYSWSYGDGGTSTGLSPYYTYTANGTYTVTLTISNGGTCTSTYTAVVNVYSVCNLTGSFGYTVISNGYVGFNSTSSGTGPSTYYQWFFGDGTTGSGSSTSHTYANGTYTVTMVVSNTVTPACADSVTQVINVTTNTCVANAAFVTVASGTPHVYYAIPSTSAGIASATWNWGDGSSSNTLFTSHTYSAAGIYNICLTIVLSCGDSATTCMWDSLSRVSGNQSIVQINVATAQQIATGIKNISNEQIAYTVAPNPGNGNFNVSINGLTAPHARITVYNVIGTVVYDTQSDVSNGTLTKDIRLNDVSDGVYFVKVGDGNNVYTKKLIINK